MTTVMIRNVPVKFPFTPYEIQKSYMEKVIDCLDTRQNGILESPTGTGKTLSLLCASLAWLEKRQMEFRMQQASLSDSSDNESFCEKERHSPQIKVPTIIYASRTHSQLFQAMQEMKRTQYSHMKACVLGSRDQMCINEDVITERDNTLKVHMCRTKVKKKSCLYNNNVEKTKKIPELSEMSIIDMEDIVDLGQCHKFCPFYMARELKLSSDVVFMPYNYLLDPKTRKALSVEFCNCIVILDEAHNIEKVCEDSSSVQITSTDIGACIDDVSAVLDVLLGHHLLPDEEVHFTPIQLRHLNEALVKFKKALEDIKVPIFTNAGASFDGDYIYEIFNAAGINETNSFSLIDLVDMLVQFLATTTTIQKSGYSLNIFLDLLNIVFYSSTTEFRKKVKECFKVHTVDEEPKKKIGFNRLSQVTQEQSCRVLSFWCFSPGFAMKMLMDQEIHCVILTSGTLAPLKPLITELEINVEVKLENPHVVRSNQVCVKILTKGPDLEPLNSNFQNRNNSKYLQSLGLVISNLIRVIPDGVLIFFPSYGIMETCQKYWQDSGIWNGINETKPIYVEPKNKISFNNAINDYYSKIKDPLYKGAIFMGVCRGKVSEGLDFADVNGRAVLITGLPYPPLKDPKIILKKQYLDFRNSNDSEYLKGNEWYNLEATRAINQAIGRVIRHKNDYGAIILLDARFTNPYIKNNMSRWLQRHIEEMKNFGEITRQLRAFFHNAKENSSPPKVIESAGGSDPGFTTFVNIEDNNVELVTINSKRGNEGLESPQKKFK